MPYKDPEQRRAHDRAYQQARYDAMSGVEYNQMLLKNRRNRALKRMEQRNNKED